MRFKTGILLAVIMQLSGCVVADMDSSNYEFVPWIQTFQKVDSSGRTDVNQRKEDLYSCGVDRRRNLDDKKWGLNVAYEHETLQEITSRNKKIFACMKSKGYQVYGFDECGPIKKPTGLCPN